MPVAISADLNGLAGFTGEDAPEPELLKACVHCGMCLSSCPTYRVTGQEMSSPRGRLWLMSAVSQGRLSVDDPVFQEQMYQCLNCRACEAVCPSGVQYGPLVEAARHQIELRTRRPLKTRIARRALLDWLFSDLRRIRLITRLTALYQRTGAQKLFRRSGVLRLLGLEELDGMAPVIRGDALLPGRESWRAQNPSRSASLFNGCIMGSAFGDTNRAAARVMARNGTDVDVPIGQGCCGALQVHSGMLEEARQLARKNIEAFEAAPNRPIVVTAAGCGSTLKEYGFLLKHDSEFDVRAKAFASRVRDFSEFVSLDASAALNEISRKVTYQDACHLAHAQRITAQPRSLIDSIPGIEFVEMPESSLCCGSAGIYNILRPEMARNLGRRKVQNLIASGAQEVITANPGCAIQIASLLREANSNIKVTHIADFLDEAFADHHGQSRANAPYEIAEGK
jgi:glycolate dehydrogenase iron-sulfur subunit